MAKKRLVKMASFRVEPATQRPPRRPRGGGRASKPRGRMDPSLTVDVPGRGRAFPEPKGHSSLCKLEKGRRAKHCFVKTLFVGRELSRKLGVEPGAYLINCTGGEKKKGKPPQHFIRVRGRRDALRRARTFCRCRDDGGSPEKCAADVGGTSAPPRKKSKPRRRR